MMRIRVGLIIVSIILTKGITLSAGSYLTHLNLSVGAFLVSTEAN